MSPLDKASTLPRISVFNSLDHIQIVLVEPTHPGNIGSVARAMKTMGLTRLTLVNPKKFPHYEASKLAAGAESVLESALVVETVADAIAECSLILGTSVRDREVSWPTFDPRISADNAINHLSANVSHEVAILFGRESSGLTNSEMDLCRAQIRIDANSDYSSLNLANAVQIICYELRMKCLSPTVTNNEYVKSELSRDEVITAAKQRQRLATQAERDGHMQHLQKTLATLDFSKSKTPAVLMRKLTRLYNKADLSLEEIQILRGILSSVTDKLERS